MLQNKRLSDVKLKIFRNITILDLVILFIYGLISFSLSFPTNNLHAILKLLIALSIFASLSWTIMINKKHNCKYYMFLIRLFNYKSQVNKYSKNFANKPHELIAYKEVLNDSVVKISDTDYFAVFNFRGYDVFANDPDDKLTYFQSLINVLNNIDFPISFVKIPHSANINKNFEYIKNKSLLATNLNLDFRKKYYENNIKDFGKLNSNNTIDNYYLVIKNTDYKLLLNAINSITMLFENTQLKLNLLKNEELIEFLNFNFDVKLDNAKLKEYLKYQKEKLISGKPQKLFNLFSNETTIKDDQTPSLPKLLSPNNVEFKKDYLIVDDKFMSYQSFNQFNTFNIVEGWAYALFNSSSKVIWNLDPLTLTQKQLILDKTIDKNDLNNIDEKSGFLKNQNNISNQVLKEVSDLITFEQMNFFYSNIILVNESDSLEKLRELETINKNNVALIQGSLNPNLFKQKQAYYNTVLSLKDYLKNNLEMLSRNIVYGWPWVNNDLNDNNNLLWGFSTSTQSPIILDIFTKNKNRTNFSMFFWGVSGAGKSAATTKLFLNYLVNGDGVIVIDPQREYKYLINKINGNWIELGKGLETSINPLQLDQQFSDEAQTISNEMIINDNIKKVQKFIKILYPDFNEKHERALALVIKEVYKKWGFYKKKTDLNNLKNSDYPIFSDLIKELKSYKFNNEIEEHFLKEIIKELWLVFSNDFENYGQYQNLYNNHTNIDLNSDFNIIDTYNLNNQSVSSQGAMFLIMNFIQSKITNNYVKNKDNKKVLLIVDEAHKFINKKNMSVIDFLFDTVKTIRKYNGSLILTTQQPSDFYQDYEIANKTQAIIENIDYSLILRLNQKDIQAVNEMYKSRGGLNKHEINFLATAPIGNGIMNVGSNYRVSMGLYYNDFEKEIIFKKGDLF